ncbi:MAG: AraC family transcriptional regulator [Phaeodactylibacter sp.]|nr:AraC family transcriptional regulator [Phaeodactylibacter sp.]
METFVTVFVWAATIQGLFLSSLYFFSQKHNSFSNKILGLFLLCLIIEAVNTFFPIEWINGYNIRNYFGLPEVKLFLPVLFFHYILEKIGASKKYAGPLRLGYGLAFLVVGLTLVNVLLFVVAGQSLIGVWSYEGVEALFNIQQTLAWALSVVAVLLSYRETRNYREVAANEYSDIEMLNINWLWQIIFLMVPVIVLWGLELLRIFLGAQGWPDLVSINWGILFIVIYFVSYKAFVQHDLFEHAPALPVSEKKAVEEEATKEAFPETLQVLESIMTKEQPYLKSDLTLHELASTVGLPSRKISQCINQHYQTNFSVWINKYRVERAIQLLQNISSSNLSIEGIGYESGFRSRSSMYLAFNKITGKSPGDFKG